MNQASPHVDATPEYDAGAGRIDHPRTVRLSTEDVWRQLGKASFAVVSHVTPTGDPRSSGVLVKAIGQRLFIVTAPDSWKAKHIAINRRVAVTVLVPRGGLLALVAPIPPATISFHGVATVHPADSMDVPEELAPLVPPERRASSCIIEVEPEGAFVTYGIGVSLRRMRTPDTARARVPVRMNGPHERTSIEWRDREHHAAAPDVVPVNDVLDGDRPVLRTHDGEILQQATAHPVSLQVDRHQRPLDAEGYL